MAKSILAMTALAAGFALSTLTPAPAHALSVPKPEITKSDQVTKVRRRGGFGRGFYGHRGFRRGFGHRRFFGPGIYVRPYYGYYGSGYGYGRSCYWLKRRALRTGSRYWWRRYQQCRWRYY